MAARKPNLFTRDDTFFGVCEALGEDLGFHPNLLRVALTVALFFAPAATIGGYLVAGLFVAGTRWAFPNPRAKAADTAQAAPQPAVTADNEGEPALLAA